jgi:hypothetical protein
MSKSMRYRAVIGSGLLLLALLTFSYSDVRLDSAALPQGAVCRVRSEQALIPRHE